jgi:small subunit ribosomal protein S6
MSKYEVVFIVDSRLSDGEKTDVVKQVAELVNKLGGKIVDSKVWIERQRMAFSINKAWEGTYYLSIVEMPEGEVARFRRELQINERILRFLLVSAVEMAPAPAAA